MPQSDKRYKDLLDSLPMAVVVTDDGTHVQYANGFASDVLKLSAHELSRITLVERVHPEDRTKVKEFASSLKKTGHMVSRRRFQDGNGNYIIIERNTSLLSDGTQLSICRDVTMEEETQRQLKLLMSIAGHELRNPLSNIQLNVDALSASLERDGFESEQVKLQSVQNIQEEIRVQDRMIGDFLDISRIGKGKLRFEMAPVDLRPLITHVIQHVAVFTDRYYDLTTQIPEGLTVWGDKDRLYQALFNVLHNAAKYSSAPSPIDITVSCMSHRCDIMIKDRGVGIRQEDQVRIFHDYFQAAEDPSSGMGIGLYLVAEIVKHHHGTLSVKSAPGKGSTFTISLPRLEK